MRVSVVSENLQSQTSDSLFHICHLAAFFRKAAHTETVQARYASELDALNESYVRLMHGLMKSFLKYLLEVAIVR